MTRGALVIYLIDQDCRPDEDCDSSASQLWYNEMNGEYCYIPHEEELSLMTYSHIFWELKVKPPFEYEDEYEVYALFRKNNLPELVKDQNKN